MVYRLGSAFYGLYFIVSFPVFLRLDEYSDSKGARSASSKVKHTVFQVEMD